ncbi:APC family permease [Acetilactobacillus jinshanensis]|uniref:APC family permease n=1 Tax=Acetilactobacillus jinshanensis TaxID=1720083 RepID=A0A4P6ZKI1_9LACO|nr:APC family permease [Acetilactobacillus jinshanensis]QBP18027.1 APC family permease [Acetilactobacillus jinshanensis]URL60890.1 APC family permease [uncultured bacterium]
MHNDRKKLTLLGLFALAISGMAPTDSLAYTTAATTKFAGYNIPVSFLLGGLGILCVAVCFAAMAKYIAGAGSVYAYNRKAFGEKGGFITGWILILAYVAIMPAHAGLVGNFANVFLKHFGLHISNRILPFILILIIWIILSLGIRFTSKIALVTELVSLLILLILSVTIFVKVSAAGNLTLKPFMPKHNNWSGIGQGTVFAVLSYSGFEEICSVSEKSNVPKKTIPKALLWTVVLAPIFFVFVTFIQVNGFGLGNMSEFANSASPLDALSVKYLGQPMAMVMDFAILLSAFSAFLGCGNACAYMLYAYSEQHYLPHQLSKLSHKFNGPENAFTFTAILTAVIYAIFGLPYGYRTVYINASTLGTLGMLITYIMICIGCSTFFAKNKKYSHSAFHMIIGILGALILVFPFISNVYPIPKFPANLYPYLIVAWIIIGFVMQHHSQKAIR